jgi:ribonucleotide monophosphatase NagD (HAD superfamily)
MDGILYHGSKPLPYAIEFITAIQSFPHVFITNNPTLLPEQIIAKLVTMGFPKPHKEHVITSGIATANYLATLKALSIILTSPLKPNDVQRYKKPYHS